jgi:hypothetical protein
LASDFVADDDAGRVRPDRTFTQTSPSFTVWINSLRVTCAPFALGTG